MHSDGMAGSVGLVIDPFNYLRAGPPIVAPTRSADHRAPLTLLLGSRGSRAATGAYPWVAMHTLLFHEPGHFHAGLLIRSANPRIDRTVHVYAAPGPDLERFVTLVAGFNSRPDDPTDWDLQLHSDPGHHHDLLGRLIAERRGELVVVAGRNEPKLATIRRLHGAGFAVLADKPWIVGPAGLPDLQQVTAGPPTAMDIMTGRHDAVNRLIRRIVATEDLFGRFAGGGRTVPDLEFGSVHHLCKTVDGRPLTRPPWYYDVAIQGDGMVDIHSHLVDQAQWLAETGSPPAAAPGTDDEEIVFERAERWSTAVPLVAFTLSTGLAEFPAAVADRISDRGSGPVLALACNGRIDYRLRGISVRQQTVWRIRPPAGGSDLHSFTARGTNCTVVVDQGPETGGRSQVRLGPAGAGRWAARLARNLERWQDEFPGLAAETTDHGHRLIIPPTLETPHEATFGLVLEDFLDRVEAGGWSSPLAATIRSRYTLLATAQRMAT